MCNRYLLIGIFLLLQTAFKGFSQNFEFVKDRKSQGMAFKFVKNLVIIPLYVNGKGPYDFILDTGVGPMIVTDPTIIDSLNFATMRKIKITGLGMHEVEAFVSQNVRARVGDAVANNIPTAILQKDLFNLSGYLGLKVYGLIGYNFFNSFIVDIRYSDKWMVFSDYEKKIKYRGSKIPIEIQNMKPYVYADLDIEGSERIRAKFLMDTGASHAISMEELNGGAFPQPEKKIKANLGMSISGEIKGFVGRTSQLLFGNYTFKNVVTAFPDFETISSKVDLSQRNGNMGGDLLKRFNIQFNYHEGFIYLKPNVFRRKSFEYDMTGITLFFEQRTYPSVIIGDVDEGSPADRAGLCVNDEIINVNFKPVDSYSLNDLTELFRSQSNRNIILEIYRGKKLIFKVVTLEKRI